MQPSTKVLMKVVAALATLPMIASAHAVGAPARKTGAPGDTTCTSCHSGTEVNAGGGRVQITAAGGANYTPGERQKITVTVTDPTAQRYGFEASARLASNLTGGQAGTLAPLGSDTHVICEDEGNPPCRATAPVQFITHSSPKNPGTFEFDWTPPADASAGEVRIYVAGNAVNGNGQPTGDHVYTSSITLNPAGASGNRPAISSTNGVQNGATFEPNIVSSSWTTVKGENLAQATRIWLESDFVNGQAPTELDGVKVNIDGKPAFVYYISPTQINVQAPALDKTGPVAVEVINANGTSNTANVEVRTAAPGWFMFDPEDRKYIAGTNSDGVFLGKAGLFGTAVTTRPPKPGDTIVLYGANFGPTNPALPAGRAVSGLAPLVATPAVQIGGTTATVSYAGGAPNLIGTYQFNLVVPDVPNGDHQVVVTLPDGSKTQDNAFITVQR